MADLGFRRLLQDYLATGDPEVGTKMVRMGQRLGLNLSDYRDMGVDWDILVDSLWTLWREEEERSWPHYGWSWTGNYGRLAMAAYCGVIAAQTLVGGPGSWPVDSFDDERWRYVLEAHAEDWPQELNARILAVGEGASREEIQEALIAWALDERFTSG